MYGSRRPYHSPLFLFLPPTTPSVRPYQPPLRTLLWVCFVAVIRRHQSCLPVYRSVYMYPVLTLRNASRYLSTKVRWENGGFGGDWEVYQVDRAISGGYYSSKPSEETHPWLTNKQGTQGLTPPPSLHPPVLSSFPPSPSLQPSLQHISSVALNLHLFSLPSLSPHLVLIDSYP